MNNIPIPIYVKEIADTWNRHHEEILRINPDWNSEPVGGATMFPTINLTSLDLEGVWLSGGPYNDADQTRYLIYALTHNNIPIILVKGTKIRPIDYDHLENFRRWLELRFQLRAD